MDWEKIEEGFDKSLMKKRTGSFGVVLYVGVSEYIKRLNEVFDYEWSFEIDDGHVQDGFVIVLGRLTAGGVTKMQYGTSRVTENKRTNAITQIGDDYKGAASDCLKKCAFNFGIGLDLYEAEERVVDNSELLQRIAKGEEMIVKKGGNVEALRDGLILEEAIKDDLEEYYKKLLSEYDGMTTIPGDEDGTDADI